MGCPVANCNLARNTALTRHPPPRSTLTRRCRPESICIKLLRLRTMPTIHFLREQLDVDCPAGAILRDAALDAGVELYGLKGKLGNCGGCGQCSTCFVAVAGPGEDICLTPRTAPEQRFLKKRPLNWRLACQAVIRDSLVVVTRPQAGWPGGDEALAAAASAMPVNVMSNPQDGAHQDSGQGDGNGQDGGDGAETGVETVDKTIDETGER